MVQVLAGDPTFVRVSKGIYALRALMGDLPYEAVGRPKKRNRKSRAGQSLSATVSECCSVPPGQLCA